VLIRIYRSGEPERREPETGIAVDTRGCTEKEHTLCRRPVHFVVTLSLECEGFGLQERDQTVFSGST
jgi:hypothetical protein